MALGPSNADLVFLPEIGTVTIRRIAATDIAAFRSFCRHIAPQDVRLRFGRMVRFSERDLFRLVAIDHDNEEAFIAVDAGGAILGVARIVLGTPAEIALIVRSDLKRRGIGRALVERIARYGRARGLATIVGYVESENWPMLGLAQRSGCELRWESRLGAIEARRRL